MASEGKDSPWWKGIVKAVLSGDTLVVMSIPKPNIIPDEKIVTLANIIAPKLARRDTQDEQFAWGSREFLRKLCIGKEITFRKETAHSNREFCTVFLGDKNIAYLVVFHGWAKVKELREFVQQKDQTVQKDQRSNVTSNATELQRIEEQARQQGLGIWNKDTSGAIRDVPPSSMGSSSSVVKDLLLQNKGKGVALEAIVEHVRDGSTVRVHLLPSFDFVQVFVAGIQAPSMGRRPSGDAPKTDVVPSNNVANGESSGETSAKLTSAERVTASKIAVVEPDNFGKEAKYFTEIRVLNREVRIVLEGEDQYGNMIASVYYPDGDTAKDLALELVQNGLARYVDWSANYMDYEARKKLKAAELEAKKKQLRLWIGFKPQTDSKPIHDQKFTGKVIEVVSGDCVTVVDDANLTERRVNLSSIRAPKMGPRREDIKPEPYAREAKEFLRARLIGRQVNVSMEYSRKVAVVDNESKAPSESKVANAADRVMDFGSVYLVSPSKNDGEDSAIGSSSDQLGLNIAELLVSRGFANVVKHRDFEERSHHYDALMQAEARARNAKKGIHSDKTPPVMHIQDLIGATPKKARDFLPFLQRTQRHSAVVEHVFSGHRFKLTIPKETCSIALSLSGVRCNSKGQPYSDEAIAFMKRRILHRDVEIEVEACDKVGTFIGSIWESKTNVSIPLLEAGLAKFQSLFADRIPDSSLLARAQQLAKQQKLRIWENYVEGDEAVNASAPNTKHKQVLKVVVTEILGGGKFYVQNIGDQGVADIQQKLASLEFEDAPVVGGYTPKKDEIVLAQFSIDNSWNRAKIVNGPREVKSLDDIFEVFYIDYGNQEKVPYRRIRAASDDLKAPPKPGEALGLAQLCRLAYLKVPTLDDEYGQEAAEYLSECVFNGQKEFRAVIEDKEQLERGAPATLVVTLINVETETSINAALLQEGLARLEKKNRYDPVEKKKALDSLNEIQEEAKKARRVIWQYGHVESDDEDQAPPPRKAGGRR